MRKSFLLTTFMALAVITALANCSNSPENNGGETDTGLKLSATNVTAERSGEADVEITFTGLEYISRLRVRIMVDGLESTQEIPAASLSEVYTYRYTVTKTAPRETILYFSVFDKDGSQSEEQQLTVLRPESRAKISVGTVIHNADRSITVPVTVDNPTEASYLMVTMTDYDTEQVFRENNPGGSSNFSYSFTVDESDFHSIKFTVFDNDGWSDGPYEVYADFRKKLTFSNLRNVSRVTGRELNITGIPDPEFKVFNNTEERFNVGGTDLGIVWELTPGKYGMFFGDTYGRDFAPNSAAPGPNGGSWRCNVLLFSEDTDLSDGLEVTGAVTDIAGEAREIAKGGKDGSGNGDWTSIPTAAIRANGYDYLHYMNIRSWTGWVTNYSGMYRSADDGESWVKLTNIIFGADSNFGQVGYFKREGYVYMVGTQTGRDGRPYLGRFREQNIERPDLYEYWNASLGRWMPGEANATVLFDDLAGELSLGYHYKYGKWIILYFNGPRYNISWRTADDITGPWSEPGEVASGWVWPQLYGSYIHPLSLRDDKLYFLMSMWLPYNVYMMSVDLLSAH